MKVTIALLNKLLLKIENAYQLKHLDIPKIVFTGSAALQVLGLIDRDCKDVDVLVIGDNYEKVTDEFNIAFPSGTDEYDGSGHERIGSVCIDGVNVDFFQSEPDDEVIFVQNQKEWPYNFCCIRQPRPMFAYKKQMNKDKCIRDIELIVKYIQS